MFFLPFLLDRWGGPLSLAVIIQSNEEENTLNEFIAQTSLPSRLTVCHFITSKPSEYPFNRLRNIALKHVTTSHFWVMDMDMWPSDNAYKTLLSLDYRYLNDDYLAVIVPSFQYMENMRECKGFKKCVNSFLFPQ